MAWRLRGEVAAAGAEQQPSSKRKRGDDNGQQRQHEAARGSGGGGGGKAGGGRHRRGPASRHGEDMAELVALTAELALQTSQQVRHLEGAMYHTYILPAADPVAVEMVQAKQESHEQAAQKGPKHRLGSPHVYIMMELLDQMRAPAEGVTMRRQRPTAATPAALAAVTAHRSAFAPAPMPPPPHRPFCMNNKHNILKHFVSGLGRPKTSCCNIINRHPRPRAARRLAHWRLCLLPQTWPFKASTQRQ
jgi:hypothetical protein